MSKKYMVKYFAWEENQENGAVLYIINSVAEGKTKLEDLSEQDKCAMSSAIAFNFHKEVCAKRKLKNINKNLLQNRAKIKELNTNEDKDFVSWVLSGKIKTSNTLFIKEGKVFMDIANTNFVNLSPYWANQNIMASYNALNNVLSSWQELTSEDENVRKKQELNIIKNIHLFWVEKNCINKQNKKLCVDFDLLPKNEQEKDVLLFEKTKEVVLLILKKIEENLKSAKQNN